MGGADAAGIVNLTEDGEKPDPVTGFARNTSAFAWGYRIVDPNVSCPTLTDRTNPLCAVTGNTTGNQFQPGATQLYNFNNPQTGAPVVAQRVTPGVDPSLIGTTSRVNGAFGTSPYQQNFLGLHKINGANVATDTSGHQDEYFDQQANSTDMRWTINDQFSIKYIFGYTDYFYD